MTGDRTKPSQLLVALDPCKSEEVPPVVASAVAFAAALHSDLRLFHVVEPLPVISLAGTPCSAGGLARYEEEALDVALKNLESIAAQCAARDTAGATPSVEVEASLGTPVFDILENAQRSEIELVAMATHGRQGIARGLLGSVTESVVRRCQKPVLTINPQTDACTRVQRVLWPTDLSEASVKVLSWLREHWPQGQALELEVLVVFDPRQPLETWNADSSAYEAFVSQHRSALTQELTQTLDPHLAGFAGVTLHTREGSPAPAIIEHAQKNDIDVIVMTTHGRRALKRLLLGSTTEEVIRHATVPVLSYC